MRCPYCHAKNLRVLESRTSDENTSIRRRRECTACHKRFTTYERVEHSPILVIKSSYGKEIFQKEKIYQSVIRACTKTQLSSDMIDEVVNKVVEHVYLNYSREIKSSQIGEIIMNELRKADPLAYLRYASIFNNFTSVVEFIDEIKSFEDNLLGIDFNNSQLALNSKSEI
jgi:transcriptional repressor NrdR